MQLATEKGMVAFDELTSLGAKSGVSFDQMSYAVDKGGKTLKATAAQMGLTNKQLSSMYKEADKSATSLQQFAEVAGMTNAEFGNMFKKDPSKAIMKFVEGLSDAEKNGKSAIAVLDDMDIKEVRLRDSLLRAANASGIFSDAVKMGNKAFNENTALAEEAGKRYETTESKLKMLKNEAVDAAIDLGGPFVDALRSGLESSKPLIKGLGELATKFSEASPEKQKFIVGMVGAVAAAGPLLSVTGKLSQGIGGIGKAFVDMRAKSVKKKAIAQLTGQLASGAVDVGTFTTALGGGSKGLSLFGKSATVAAGTGSVGAGGVAGLGASLAAIAVPATIAIAAVAAVGTAVYLGKKAYDEHQLSGAKWGTEVTKEQDKVIDKSYELQEKAVASIDAYGDGVKGAADKAVKANKDIVDSIQEVLEKENKRKKNLAEDIKDPEAKSRAEKSISFDEKMNQQIVKNAQSRVDKINTVVNNASQNNRKISDEERQYINANYKLLSKQQLEAAGFEKGQILAIQSAYQDDLSKMTAKQLFKRENTVAKALNTELESYEEQKEKVKELYGENTAAYEAESKRLEKSYRKNADTMITGYAKLSLAQGRSLDSMQEVWKRYGYTVDEVSALVNTSVDKTSNNLDMFARGTSEADIKWNELAFDPKTGEVKTNIADTLVDIAKTENGWNELKFMAKNADLTTNAKQEIAIAMGEVDKWQFLSMEDKNLLLSNDEALRKVYDSIDELGLWNAFNTDRKNLGIDNTNSIYETMHSIDKLKEWNELSPALKKLIVDDSTKISVSEATKSIEEYNNLPEKMKKLLADNTDVSQKIESAQQKLKTYDEAEAGVKHLHATADMTALDNSENKLNRWQELKIDPKSITIDNYQLMMAVSESKESLNQYNSLSPIMKTLLADGPAKMTYEQTKQALDEYNLLPESFKTLLADNADATSKIDLAKVSLDSYNFLNPQHKLLTGDNSNVSNAAAQGGSSLNNFNANNPSQKQLTGNSVSTVVASTAGQIALDNFARNNPNTKNLNANDNASGPAYEASRAVAGFGGNETITKTLNVFANIGKGVASILGLEKGTNYHVGGPAIVNDQTGSMYKELVVPKGGVPFIPEGRDVFLPDLPKGSKVYKASKTKSIMQRMGIPHYAKGVGIPEDSRLIRDMKNLTGFKDSQTIISYVNDSTEFKELSSKVDNIIEFLAEIANKNSVIMMDKKIVGVELADVVDAEIEKNRRTKNIIMKGRHS